MSTPCLHAAKGHPGWHSVLLSCCAVLQVGTIRLAGRTTSSFSRGELQLFRLQPAVHVLDQQRVVEQPPDTRTAASVHAALAARVIELFVGAIM